MKQHQPTRTTLLILLTVLFFLTHAQAQELMKYSDLAELPVDPTNVQLSYGADSLQFGDLRIPEGKGPHKVVVIIHGGCWLSAYDLSLMDAMATQLTRDGYATWNLEYRRVGDPEGAWPNTFLDVAKGINFLRDIAEQYELDLDHVVVTGHSAGGHLTLWQALQHQISKNSDIYHPDPLPISGVVSLAGIVDPSTYLVREGRSCGTSVDELLGGLPEDVSQRYIDGSPIDLLPSGTRTILITGKQDTTVPLSHINPYYEEAKSKGDWIKNIKVDQAAHFEVIAPGSTAWRAISKSIKQLIRKQAK